MIEKLLIYTETDDSTILPFPSNGDQASINSYTFSEGRMGSVNISSTLMYPRCLDDEWTRREFVEFRGEKYWILDTPTSSKSNTDLRYKHELNFKSERTKLDNTYFFDVVSPDAEDVDQFVSNSTKFTFFGDIKEFVTRLNYSLQYSKVGYSVVIDEGITSEAKLLTFEDKYFSEVLQEVFNTYELPYYFVGKVIHIGFTSNAITHTFKYGHDRELLTIAKTNANYKIVNRCTGIGSTENIPYYYPNDTRKTEVGVEAYPYNISIKQNDITIVSEDKFKKEISVNEAVEYKEITNINYFPHTTYFDSDYQYKYDEGGKIYIPNEDFAMGITGAFAHKYFYIQIHITEHGRYYTGLGGSGGLTYNGSAGGQSRPSFIGVDFSEVKFSELGSSNVIVPPQVYINHELVYDLGELEIKEYLLSFKASTHLSHKTDWMSNVYMTIYTQNSRAIIKGWYYNNLPTSLDRIGISIDKQPSVGDKFKQIKIEKDYMITSPNLLPSIYRDTFGADRFYNAKNNTYISPETGEYYNFENEYSEGNPKEMIVSFDYIKPTIKGIKNASGQLIGEILDVAFDDDDNDEIDPKNNEYEHKFFYIKLRKFDGEYGFNIFEQAIAGNDMTISMTSGNCAACNFVISVLEKTNEETGQQTFKNPVQVDDNGNIVPGSTNDKWKEANIQPIQQDTTKSEVWIRVSKEDETFGVIMPSNNRNYKPKTGDSFVILHIDLPKQYILNAENELKEAIIKYMAANNSEKFNFSISFKRIFFAQYPEMLAQINSNARLQIAYNQNEDGTDKLYELYVSNYTYKVSENEILPEITVELSETITIRKGNVQKSIDAVKQDIMSSIGSIDFLKMGLKYFIRKDTDDHADGEYVFNKSIYVSGEGYGLGSSDTSLIIEGDNDYIQENITGDYIQEYAEVEEVVEPSSITLGDLSNVNDIVDNPVKEDVVLVKKAGSDSWTQETKSAGSTDKVYITTLDLGYLENDTPDVTQEDKDEVLNIIQKFKEGYVVTYTQNTVSLHDSITRYTPLSIILSEDEVEVYISYTSFMGRRCTLTMTPIFEVGSTWEASYEMTPPPHNGKTYGINNGIWVEIQQGGGGTITVDDHLDLQSTNPVQNKILTMSINELMDEVFKLSFKSFSGGGTYEKGSVVTPAIYWSLSRKGEEVLPTFASVNGSTDNVSADKKSWTSPSTINTSNNYSVICRYEAQEVSRVASYSFMLKKYWGTSTNTTLTNQEILALSSGWASRTMGKTQFDCTGGKYIYYIIPNNIYGNGVEFWVNGFKNTDTTVTDVVVTNIYNVSESYKMIRLNNIQTGKLEVEFK